MATSTSGPGRKTATTPARKAATPKAARTTQPAGTAETKRKTPSTAAPPEPRVVEDSTPDVSGSMLKKPALIDRVMAETGMKKKDVKPVVESTLNVLGLGLANGEDMNLPPLGKVRVNRTKDLSNAKVIVTKVRQPKARAPVAKDPLADTGE